MSKANIHLRKELENRIRFETLIADISARFVRVSSDEVDSEIDCALKQVLEFFRVDRLGVLKVSEDKQSVYIAHAYYTEGLEEVSKDIDMAELFPYAHSILVLKEEPFIMVRLSDLPPEGKQDQLTWSAMGVKSVLITPLYSTQGVRYLFTIETIYKEYEWPKEFIPRVTLLGEIFVNALERRDKDLALRESESRLNLAADSAGVGLWALDVGSKFLWATQRTRELFGFSLDDEITFEQYLDVVHPDDRDLIDQAMQTVLQSKEETSVTYRIVRSDGSIRWVTSRGRASVSNSGEPDHVMGVAIDITEHKHLQDQVAHAAEEWKHTFDAVQDLVLILDSEFKIVQTNRSAERFFQYHPQPIIGSRCYTLIYGRDMPVTDCPVKKALHSKQHEECEIYLDQKKVWLHISANPLFDEKGDIVGFVNVLKDITQRKQDEQKLLDNREALRVFTGRLLTIQEEERRTLARELHDDFTQRLAVLAMDISKLEMSAVPENTQLGPKLKQIKDEIIKLSTNIHDISRQLHPSIIDDLGLGRAIQSECNLFTQRVGIVIDFQPINVSRTIDRDISMVLFRVTQESLRNIHKHAQVEKADVCLVGEENRITLIIHDSGVGFEPAHCQHAHGLGLLSMKERVQLIQGTFSIDSAPGRGTQIRVVVPLS